LSSVLYFNSSN